MAQYDSNLDHHSVEAQTQNSVDKLHHAVSQALSHPAEQLIEQAEQSRTHAENAIEQAKDSLGDDAVEVAEDMLGEEVQRLEQAKKTLRP
ncbi:hypothetical protein ACWHAM_16390 [Paenibacillus terrae]